MRATDARNKDDLVADATRTTCFTRIIIKVALCNAADDFVSIAKRFDSICERDLKNDYPPALSKELTDI